MWGVQKGGERCSSATWTLQLTAVEDRQKRQRPPKQERRRVGVSLRQSTSGHPLLRRAHPPSPANSPREAGRDVAMCRRKCLHAPTFGGSVTATSRPVGSFVSLIMRWRTTSAALPSCGAARYGVLGVPPPRLSPRSAAVRRQVLTGQFDQSTLRNEQGRVQSDGSSSPAESGAAHAWPSVLDSFR